jgi:acyl carrier protein phosphodiesterase
MNYLGHIFLSGENDLVMFGNFIGDYVKGNQFIHFPDDIKKGLLLHRAIDDYTDQNPNWIEIRAMIKPVYGRYSGVATDLFVDHFLAANWDIFSPYPLHIYAKWAHAVFLRNYDFLPPRVKDFIAYIIHHKRFLSYKDVNGIAESLYIMSLRTSLPDNTNEAIGLLTNHYNEFSALSLQFLNEAISFVEREEKFGIKLPIRSQKTAII